MSKLKGFIGETLVYGFANVFSRFFAMLLIPFYANYLGKFDYSNLVMLQSLFGVATFLLGLNSGVFFYYYQYNNSKYKKIVFTSWFYYSFIISIFLFVFLYVGLDWTKSLFIITNENNSILGLAVLLMGIQLFPYSFNNTNINYFRIERKPKMVTIIVFAEALVTLVCVYVSLSILKLGLISVVVCQIIARSIVAILFYKTTMVYLNYKFFSSMLLRKMIAYSWPFFIISFFGWGITSVDKFIGVESLNDKTEIALLALSMQFVIPITIISDMIRMAIGPYVMSLYKDEDAHLQYQKIFDLCVFVSSVVLLLIVVCTPFLTLILTNKSFLPVIYIVPLMALANVFSIIANQFSVCFNLVKKNIYILYAYVLSGIVGIAINYFLMHKFGSIVSGYAQIASYLIMSAFLYYFGRRVAGLSISLRKSYLLMFIIIIYIAMVRWLSVQIMNEQYLPFIGISLLTAMAIVLLYLRIQKISFAMIYGFVHLDRISEIPIIKKTVHIFKKN
jgi:O-antigen/teichoic acid export membrane protein